MAVKVYLLLVALVFAGVVAPVANAQLINLAGLLGGIIGGGGSGSGGGILGGIIGGGSGSGSGGGILGGIIGGILQKVVSVTGLVHCSVGGSIHVSNSIPFANAGVQLNCAGNVVANTTTNSNGAFGMSAGLVGTLLSVLDDCKVEVITPLASCNASLPSEGILVAPLTQAGSVLGVVTNLVAGVFKLVGV